MVERLGSHTDAEALINTRVGVWWPADETYYRATVTNYDATLDRHLICYDDQAKEWLSLRSEQFTWLTPRGSSAGGNAACRGALVEYGARNVPPFCPPPPRIHTSTAQPRDVLGHMVSVWSPVDGAMHHGEVIACRKGRMHVLYDDGEDEVLDVHHEVIAWDAASSPRETKDVMFRSNHATRAAAAAALHTPARRGRPPRVHPSPGGPGVVLAGGCTSHPTRKAAIGWRVALHDPTSMCFVPGVVGSYYAASNTYRVKFDVGGAAVVSLRSHRIKWVFPPGVVEEEGETEEEGGMMTEDDDSEAADDSAMTTLMHDTPCCSGGGHGGGVEGVTGGHVHKEGHTHPHQGVHKETGGGCFAMRQVSRLNPLFGRGVLLEKPLVVRLAFCEGMGEREEVGDGGGGAVGGAVVGSGGQ